MDVSSSNSKRVEIPADKILFFGSGTLIAVLVALMIIYEQAMGKVFQILFDFFTDQLGALYLWGALISAGFILWLSFGKYKDVRLGGPDSRPEFSTATWLSMVFCSGIGSALLAWGTKEWSYYYVTPPFGIEPMSVQAAEMGMSYAFFHWGLLGWVIYCIMAFPVGYAYYNRGHKSFRFSTSCIGVIGEKNARGAFGKFMDFILLFGLMGGNITALASGIPMLTESASRVIGIPHTFMLEVIVTSIWMLFFLVSVVFSMKKGLAMLTNVTIVGVFAFCSILFILGPTWFIVNNFTNSIGIMGNDFIRMAFYTDPIGKSMFPQWWTVFYWAWYFAFAPYMGAFIARISKGRSFREIAFGVIFSGSLGCIVFHAVLGGNAMYLQINNIFDFVHTLKTAGDFDAIVGSFAGFPFAAGILALFTLVGFLYAISHLSATAYTMASISSVDIETDGAEPKWWNKIFWAAMLAGSSLVILKIGGLTPIKAVSLIVALPILFFVMMSLVSLSRWLRQDQPQLLQPTGDPASEKQVAAE